MKSSITLSLSISYLVYLIAQRARDNCTEDLERLFN